ncbi:thiamine biosynthesis protein ThiS [Candidatus Woesearchaeota archaeon]|jgi:sulfur carrier protein|nr:thiamine biosynthesis protein ThiS [Candidatus Woesearchaeota archaeon]|tara:strand:+ start:308 stop:514 length:207 start_codon:yes stop_codon:yes gene_type:complete
MQINVFFDREKKEKTIEVGENSLIRDLLAKMGINPVTVIVSRNDTIIMEDDEINDKDKIKLISVISGG